VNQRDGRLRPWTARSDDWCRVGRRALSGRDVRRHQRPVSL